MRTARLVGVAVLLVCATTAALAEEVVIPVDRVVTISNPADGSFRLLLTFSGLSDLVGRELLQARLLVPGLSSSTEFRIDANPIASAWSPAAVAWSSPWRSPGGDYDDVIHSSYLVVPERDPSRPVVLNVSGYVAGVLSGNPDYGLLLRPPEFQREGFPPSLSARFAAVGSIRIVARLSHE